MSDQRRNDIAVCFASFCRPSNSRHITYDYADATIIQEQETRVVSIYVYIAQLVIIVMET